MPAPRRSLAVSLTPHRRCCCCCRCCLRLPCSLRAPLLRFPFETSAVHCAAGCMGHAGVCRRRQHPVHVQRADAAGQVMGGGGAAVCCRRLAQQALVFTLCPICLSIGGARSFSVRQPVIRQRHMQRAALAISGQHFCLSLAPCFKTSLLLCAAVVRSIAAPNVCVCISGGQFPCAMKAAVWSRLQPS